MLTNGWLRIFSLGRITVRLHWSVLLLFVFFGGFRFAPGAWLGLLLVILVHELGHAALARSLGVEVHGIEVTGYGGVCRHATTSARNDSVIAWGGVLAQAALLLITLGLRAARVFPTTPFFADLNYALTINNLVLIALNLLPFPPLDGASAWKLFSKKQREAKATQRRPPSAPSRPRKVRKSSNPKERRAPLRAAPRELSAAEKEGLKDQVQKAIDSALNGSDRPPRSPSSSKK